MASGVPEAARRAAARGAEPGEEEPERLPERGTGQGLTGYEVDDDPRRIDVDVAWAYLSTEAYWGRWRTREVFDHQVRGAWRVVGAYERSTGAMVGFARALSDGVALAYLADVFVDPDHQGRGLGRAIVARMIDEGPGARFRWMLHTRDAHDVYRPLGFDAPDGTYMERRASQ